MNNSSNPIHDEDEKPRRAIADFCESTLFTGQKWLSPSRNRKWHGGMTVR